MGKSTRTAEEQAEMSNIVRLLDKLGTLAEKHQHLIKEQIVISSLARQVMTVQDQTIRNLIQRIERLEAANNSGEKHGRRVTDLRPDEPLDLGIWEPQGCHQ